MNCTCVRLAAAMVALAWAGFGSAQTTRPAPAVTWSATVEQVAKATEAGDVPLVAATLARDGAVRSFESPEPAAARTLVDAAADWKLLGTHAYEFPPATLAVDIAADVKRSDLIAEVEKRKIIPLDHVEAARANATAAEWLARTLGAERDHLVGVATFWNVKTNRPMFVLMKGQPGVHDAYTVKLAVYGDPMVRRANGPGR